MNLSEKEMWVREHVAYPTVEEYGFSGCDAETRRLLAVAVNKILAAAFEHATFSPEDLAFGHIMRLVYRPLIELQQRYHDIGLRSPSTYCTIAYFWGLNYSPEIYQVMCFPSIKVILADRTETKT
jgi:hypothetical protein